MLKSSLAILVATLALSGCSQPEDMVKVDVPKDVQKATGAPAKVTLNQFKEVREDYEATVKAKAEAKAEEAAKVARGLTKLTKQVENDVADEIAAVQRAAAAKLRSIEDDANADHERIAAAQRAIAAEFERVAPRLSKLQENAQQQADQLRSLINFGLNEIAPGVANMVPGVGFALPLITGLAGLWMRKPGDGAKFAEQEAKHAKELKAATDAAYDEGRRVAVDAVVRGSLLKLNPADVAKEAA